MKKLVLTSLILILVPTLFFTPVYIHLIVSSLENVHDFTEDVQGGWTAIQYYHGSERVACNEEHHISISFEGDVITVSGNVLPESRTAFSWIDGTTLTYEVNGETFTYLLSFDANNYLKIIVDGTSYIILLRRSEG